MAAKVYPDRRPKSLKLNLPVQQSIEFSILNGHMRQGCVLRTTFLSSAHAMSYLKTRRGKIEAIAKQRLCDGLVEDGIVYVDMI